MRTALLYVLFTGVALAAGGGGHAPETFGDVAFKIGAHALNLAFLLGLIVFLAGGKIRDALANRSALVKRDVEDAAQARQEAQARYEELEARLDDFEKELAKMRSDADAQVAREVQSIEERAQRDAALIKEAARRTIRDEGERARQGLRRDAVELAVELARQQVQRDINDADRKRFADEFMTAVKGQEVANG